MQAAYYSMDPSFAYRKVGVTAPDVGAIVAAGDVFAAVRQGKGSAMAMLRAELRQALLGAVMVNSFFPAMSAGQWNASR